MYTIITATVLSAVVVWITSLGQAPFGLGEVLIMYGIFMLIGAMTGLVIAALCYRLVPTLELASETMQLVSMRSNDGPTAVFLWKQGALANTAYFAFVFKNVDGSVSPGQVRANSKVRIFEDSELEDTAELTTILTLPDPTSRMFRWALCDWDSFPVRYEFRLPAGSILHQCSAI